MLLSKGARLIAAVKGDRLIAAVNQARLIAAVKGVKLIHRETETDVHINGNVNNPFLTKNKT